MTLPGTLAALATHWRRLPRADAAELRAWQEARLAEVVRHAGEAVPFWRSRFDQAGVDHRAVRSLADLAGLPLTSRADLQAAPPADLVAAGVPPEALVTRTTSGSSGRPFTVVRTRAERSILQLLRFRAYRFQGARATDRMVRIGTPRPPLRRAVWPLRRCWQAMRRQWAVVDAFLPPDQALDQVAALQPDLLGGYPGVIDTLAQAALAAGRRDIRPRLIGVGAEVLTPAMRRRITQAFGAPVRQTYGASEFDLLAWECRAGSLHVCEDGVVLEILRPDGTRAAPGERGEVVATALHSFAMPIIRYRLGDLAVAADGPCACGSPFRVIGPIEGRTMDYLLLPDGQRLHPHRLLAGIARGDEPWVRRYQLVQTSADRIQLRLVGAPPAGALEILERRLRAALAQASALPPLLSLELRDEIPPEPGGKYRAVRPLAAASLPELVTA